MLANVHQFLIEFSSSSTVHGVNYFGDRRRHWIERVFWIVVFVVSMSACFFTVHKTYAKWQSSPIIVTQEDKLTAIWEIPFPAVTVCPAAKVKLRWPVNLTRTQDELILTAYRMWLSGFKVPSGPLMNFKLNIDDLTVVDVTEKELLLLEAVDHICPLTNAAVDYLEDTMNSTEIIETLKTYALNWYDVFVAGTLKFKGALKNSAALPERVFTEEGVCYTFNGLRNEDIFRESAIADDFRPYESQTNTIDWNPEDGFKQSRDKKIFPRRAFNSNPRNGLSLTLFQASDVCATGCPLTQEKLKILIHSPADFPLVGYNSITVPFNEELKISVKPVMMTTSPDLVKYPVDVRQCYFNSDRSLKFFKYYSQSNCEYECLTNFTLLACDCVRVTMPRDNVTKVCLLEDRYCVLESEKLIQARRLDDADDGVEDNESKHKFDPERLERLMQHSCGCLPSCVSLNYELVTSHFVINDKDRVEVYPESNVMVYFEAGQFLKTKRSEIYGWGDFIANCGGLLGLFMGVSILSIIEIIYFATLRLACTMKVTKNNVVAIESGIENTQIPVFERTLRLQLLEWDRY